MPTTQRDPLEATSMLLRVFCDVANDPRHKDGYLVGRINEDNTVEFAICRTEQQAIALRDKLPPEERYESFQPFYTDHHLMPGQL